MAVQSDGAVTAPPGVCVANEAELQLDGPVGRALSNTRLKLAAHWRRFCRNAQWRPSFLIAAPTGRSLSATR